MQTNQTQMTPVWKHKQILCQNAASVKKSTGNPIRVQILDTAEYQKQEDQAYAEVSGLKGVVVDHPEFAGLRVYIPLSQQSFEYHGYMLRHWIEEHRGLVITGTILGCDVDKGGDLRVSQSKYYLDEITTLNKLRVECLVTETGLSNNITGETSFRGQVELGCGYSVTCEAKIDSFEKNLPEPNVGDTVQVEVYFSSNQESRFPKLYAHYIKIVARKEEASTCLSTQVSP